MGLFIVCRINKNKVRHLFIPVYMFNRSLDSFKETKTNFTTLYYIIKKLM